MLASVLNTETAIQASVLIVRAFVKLREILLTHKELSKKLTELEAKYDNQFKIVFQVLKDLMQSENNKKERQKIGFRISGDNK
jgi:putative hemolysin